MKIFISSTYIDLIDLRKITFDYFNEFASSIQTMEVWGASNENPLERCLKKVRESDLYIGIIGHRYGYVAPQYNKSITELEYLEAKRHNIDRLILIMDDNYQIASKFVDKGESASKLDEFRTNLMNEHFVSLFSDKQIFSKGLNNSFRNYLIDKNIDVDKLNFKTIWDEISEAFDSNKNYPDFKLDWKKPSTSMENLNEIESVLEGLEDFHKYISESYENMNSDLISVLKEFSETEDELNERIFYKENPFLYRDWEMVTFFPNRTNTLRMHLMVLKLKALEQQALTEPWSSKLVTEISSIKEQLKTLVRDTAYID
ncbi:DUF4062 domain-containing protein [Fusibacter ferrireducens]|uniref:DUF4062 domain-containing protein n=1 Tax=Fusibacter ferrireducens TaxID=2785058 RepID=A0ABS0A1P5_9FIRM|nr:DUF4062 domain-containing protein [Fusibacter ferrireducens]MBF4696075.1 DUF4062 domain-containing protein [Fusibacter ferrireducens]